MGYRNQLDAIAETPSLLDGAGAGAKAKLPILDNIQVAAPCPASWDAMVGDDRVRHCSGCDKRVYHLSNMTRAEAQALLVATEGKLCARYYQRADGTILTKDCAVGVRRRRRLRVVMAAGVAALVGVGALSYELTDGAREQPIERMQLERTPTADLVTPPAPPPRAELPTEALDIEIPLTIQGQIVMRPVTTLPTK